MLEANREIDVTGQTCPVPVLKTKKALATMVAGEVLRVLATDPVASRDLRQFCEQTGHVFLSEEKDEILTFYIRKKA